MILSINSDAKTVKGLDHGVLTAICYMSPHDTAIEGKTVCPFSTAGCRSLCLFTAGNGQRKGVEIARTNRTLSWFEDRARFLDGLTMELSRFDKRSSRLGLFGAVRLNGTSDLPWWRIKHHGQTIPDTFPDLQFYDYTKHPPRTWLGRLPVNYDLTLSVSESNKRTAINHCRGGGRIAVVVGPVPRVPCQHTKRIDGLDRCLTCSGLISDRSTVWGFPALDGDLSDIRFRDPRPSVVVLRPKGKARRDQSGFVYPPSIIKGGRHV